MTARKTVSKNSARFGAKADFIRNQPVSLSAKEVVEAAKKAGLKVTVNHVYNIRAAGKRQEDSVSPRSVAAPSSHALSASRRSRRTGPVSTGASAALEVQLRRAIAEVGLQRAREIFDSVESVFVRG